MSQENVEIVKDFSRRFAEGTRGVTKDFDPDIVWDTSASGLPAAGIYHGHEGVRSFFRDWLAPWEDHVIEYREYIDAGDTVVQVFWQAGTGRSSGIRTERDFFGVWDLKNSKVIRYRLFGTRAEALEAAGLQE
jgi:uncharacterized protein